MVEYVGLVEPFTNGPAADSSCREERAVDAGVVPAVVPRERPSDAEGPQAGLGGA
jgi:hypothetical protein